MFLTHILLQFAYSVIKDEDIGPQTNMRFYIETLFIVCGTFTIAFLVDSLAVVLAFVGAIGCVASF